MIKRPPYLGLTIIAAFVLIVSVIAFRRYLPYSGRDMAPKQPPSIILAMEKAYLVGLGHDGKRWSVRADKVEMDRYHSTATVNNITEGRIYDKGVSAFNVRAGQAVFDIAGENLTMKNGVSIEGAGGERITGQGAIWNSRNSTLMSTGWARFENDTSRIAASKLIVNLRTKELEMWDIKMLVSPKALAERARTVDKNAL